MKKSSIVILVIIILVIIGIIAVSVSVYNPNVPPAVYNNTSTTTDVTVMHSVNYTDSGFSPSTVTVSQGETVVFMNNSSGDMWVASNPHPSHTDLPGFDELQSIGPGQTWNYTFSQIGTWSYHNHRKPSAGGTVVVQ